MVLRGQNPLCFLISRQTKIAQNVHRAQDEKSVPTKPALFALEYAAVLHHERNFADRLNVIEGIFGHGDNIGG